MHEHFGNVNMLVKVSVQKEHVWMVRDASGLLEVVKLRISAIVFKKTSLIPKAFGSLGDEITKLAYATCKEFGAIGITNRRFGGEPVFTQNAHFATIYGVPY